MTNVGEPRVSQSLFWGVYKGSADCSWGFICEEVLLAHRSPAPSNSCPGKPLCALSPFVFLGPFLHLNIFKMILYRYVAKNPNILILYFKTFSLTERFIFFFWFWKELKHFLEPLKVLWPLVCCAACAWSERWPCLPQCGSLWHTKS